MYKCKIRAYNLLSSVISALHTLSQLIPVASPQTEYFRPVLHVWARVSCTSVRQRVRGRPSSEAISLACATLTLCDLAFRSP